MITWIWAGAILAVLVLYFRRTYSRFSKYGVKHLNTIPLLGNMAGVVFRKEHVSYLVDRVYNTFPKERFLGNYEFVAPMVIIRDLELVKKVTVKDCEYFLDHRSLIEKETEPYMGGNLVALKGQEWKEMRSTLSPAFTSSKIRLMVPFMVEVGDQMLKALKNKIENSGVDYIDIDAKDLTARCSNDIIATCAFGLKVDSHADGENQFFVRAKEAVTLTFKQLLIIFAFRSFPKLMNKMKIHLLSETTRNFFSNMILGTIKDREARHIIRPDMIHLLMEARKGRLSHDDKANDAGAGFATTEESEFGKIEVKKELTDDDLVAQAVLFFIAGFETISTTLSFLLHELAVNPDVQEKLFLEIKEFDAKNGGKLDFNTIQQMTYMDMVISEVLRLWPAAPFLDRLCVKDYNMGRPNDEAKADYIIRKGEGVQIPTWSFHHDPEFFPMPHKFNPERFSEKYKHNIKPFTYMPFGLGPRNCIGSRFALCEVKVITYQLLKAIEVSPAEKTCIPAVLSKSSAQMQIEGGHWVRMKLRR